MKLSPRQLAQYRAQGFAGPHPILTAHQLQRLHAEMEAMIEALPPGQRPENMASPHTQNEYIRDLLLSDPFVDVADQILGPGQARQPDLRELSAVP